MKTEVQKRTESSQFDRKSNFDVVETQAILTRSNVGKRPASSCEVVCHVCWPLERVQQNGGQKDDEIVSI